ncbi:MAG: ADP-forming succinate--CoA ligase subunit beta [Thermoplasmata archaeon]
MVKLPEYLGKEIFKKYGIPVPEGKVFRRGDKIEWQTFPVCVKAQVLAGKRGKAGAIKFASSMQELELAAAEILTMKVGGYSVNEVLVEEKLNILKEYYLSITLDRDSRCPVLLASASGGMDVEEVPDSEIHRVLIHPFVGIQPYMLREIAMKLGLDKDLGKVMGNIVRQMYQIFVCEDAELVEINPLVDVGAKLVAADAKVIIEDDALFRHPEYKSVPQEFTELERRAREKDISFIQLDGDIGIIANGAGLTMATLDALTYYGGKPAVFLDLGGTDDVEKVKEAFKLVLEVKPKAVLVNIFGGVTKCDTVAKGIVEVLGQNPQMRIAARIKGFNEEEARQIFANAGIRGVKTLDEAARFVCEGGA